MFSLSRIFHCLIGVLCLSLVIASPVTAGAATTWTATATRGVGPLLANAADLGPLAPDTPMHLVVALALQDQGGLQQLIQEENTLGNALYGTAITPSQFTATYAPTPAQVQAVTAYLANVGMTNIQAESNSLFVTADATAGEANSAFNTILEQYSQGGRTVYANTSAAEVPTSLGSIVVAVLGLNNVFQMQFFQLPVCGPMPAPCVGQFFTPQGFQQAYDALSTPTGGKTKIAIFAEGDVSGVITDLRYAEAQNHLPQVPVQVGTGGFAGHRHQRRGRMGSGYADVHRHGGDRQDSLYL